MRCAGLFFTTVVLAVAASTLVPAVAPAGSDHKKRWSARAPHDYGFLPGYEPPEVVEWRRRLERRPAYWYGGPGFYHGRWNGGGFGPCWTQTPIGNHWNCG
jgi:hypothetical protein